MFTKDEINELKSALPSNGVLLLRRRTRISRLTIYKFLEGTDIRIDLAEQIWKEGWTIVQEAREKKAELKRHADQVLNKKYE